MAFFSLCQGKQLPSILSAPSSSSSLVSSSAAAVWSRFERPLVAVLRIRAIRDYTYLLTTNATDALADKTYGHVAFASYHNSRSLLAQPYEEGVSQCHSSSAHHSLCCRRTSPCAARRRRCHRCNAPFSRNTATILWPMLLCHYDYMALCNYIRNISGFPSFHQCNSGYVVFKNS